MAGSSKLSQLPGAQSLSSSDLFYVVTAASDVSQSVTASALANFVFPLIPVSLPFINVKNAPYNAKGDGVTDDTAAIQTAINAGANLLYFPPGTYLCASGLTIPAYHDSQGWKYNIVLKGNGGIAFPTNTPPPAASTILFTGSAGLTAFGVIGLVIEDLAIRYNSTSMVGPLINGRSCLTGRISRSTIGGTGSVSSASTNLLLNGVVGFYCDTTSFLNAQTNVAGHNGDAGDQPFANVVSFSDCNFSKAVLTNVANPDQSWAFARSYFEPLQNGQSNVVQGHLISYAGQMGGPLYFTDCWVGDGSVVPANAIFNLTGAGLVTVKGGYFNDGNTGTLWFDSSNAQISLIGATFIAPAGGATLFKANTNTIAPSEVGCTFAGTWTLPNGFGKTLARVVQSVQTITWNGSNYTILDVVPLGAGGGFTDGYQISNITLSASGAVVFPTAAAGKTLTVELVQNGTGGWTVTWPGTVTWLAGFAPSIGLAPNALTLIKFVCIDGTNWLGYQAGGKVTYSTASLISNFTAGEIVSGSLPVCIMSGGWIGTAQGASGLRMPAFGIPTQNVLSGVPINVLTYGVMNLSSGSYQLWSGSYGNQLFVSSSGYLMTPTQPTTGLAQCVGLALSGGLLVQPNSMMTSGAASIQSGIF